ncbi:MAG: 50S ribosomal protein L18 [Deltaproteobacteria bacterium]|nr:50S ribosomal protein L18 [Candidatus Zymogenaceae bacterium]
MKSLQRKTERAIRRKRRTRLKIRGTSERPRLTVFRSNKHIYVQIIDDSKGVTLAASSTREKDLAKKFKKKGSGGNIDAAKQVGTDIAKKAKDAGVERVVFDRGSYLFHGRVKALADAAREGGLLF